MTFAETLGLWYFTAKAKIPGAKLDQFLVVYQLSVLAYCVSILRIPYLSGVLAQEKMKLYAYISIFESCLKLVFAWTLMSTNYDKAIYYASTILILTIIINLTYIAICSLKQKTLYRISTSFEPEVIKPIIRFSGWRILGATSQTIDQGGVVLLINYFFNATANASLAISSQVNQRGVLWPVRGWTA